MRSEAYLDDVTYLFFSKYNTIDIYTCYALYVWWFWLPKYLGVHLQIYNSMDPFIVPSTVHLAPISRCIHGVPGGWCRCVYCVPDRLANGTEHVWLCTFHSPWAGTLKPTTVIPMIDGRSPSPENQGGRVRRPTHLSSEVVENDGGARGARGRRSSGTRGEGKARGWTRSSLDSCCRAVEHHIVGVKVRISSDGSSWTCIRSIRLCIL
jgi:hypothetical protein